jgi:hypothetical protein
MARSHRSRASVAAGVAASSRVLRVQVAAWLGLSHLCLCGAKKKTLSLSMPCSFLRGAFTAKRVMPCALQIVCLFVMHIFRNEESTALCVPLTHLRPCDRRRRHRTHAARTLNFFCINYYDWKRLCALLFGTYISSSAEPHVSQLM